MCSIKEGTMNTDMAVMQEGEIRERLGAMKDWMYSDGALKRSFKFKDFREAFDFMCRAASLSERMDHHPDWENSYNKVNIALSTHKAGGVTKKDFEWAGEVEGLVHSGDGGFFQGGRK